MARPHVLSPVTTDDGSSWTSLWLADRVQLGNPVVQLTNQKLDGQYQANVALFQSWEYEAARREHVALRPELVVYGLGGHLWSARLKKIEPPMTKAVAAMVLVRRRRCAVATSAPTL